jgi:hypothetical protein
MPYLGNTPTTQSFISGTDYFNGTGAQTAFTLTRSVASVNDIQAVVNNVVQVPNDAYTLSGTTITFTSAPSAGTQNVYVRYLSTTTQAITPSQGTVSWSTLDSNIQQDLGLMYKNKIINGAMTFNQRNAGASVTPTNGQYVLDRWINYQSVASKYSIQQNAGSVTPPVGFSNYAGMTSLSSYSLGGTDYFTFEQALEGFNVSDLAWGSANARTVTLSFWVRSSLTGTFGGALYAATGTLCYPFSYTISAANTWEQKSVTITGPTTGTFATNNTASFSLCFGIGVGSTYSGTAGSWQGSVLRSVTGAVNVVGTNGATFYLTGVQLEVGTQATTFTTAGGSYGAELALCQRYYWRLKANNTVTNFCIGLNTGTTSARHMVQFPVSMRTAPTAVEQSGTASDYRLWHGSGTTTNLSAVPAFDNANELTANLSLTVASGLTGGGFSILISNSGTAGYLAWSAEL